MPKGGLTMQDAQLRREYHRLCRKKPGTLADTESCFRAFKAGLDYAVNKSETLFEQLTTAYESQAEMEG